MGPASGARPSPMLIFQGSSQPGSTARFTRITQILRPRNPFGLSCNRCQSHLPDPHTRLSVVGRVSEFVRIRGKPDRVSSGPSWPGEDPSDHSCWEYRGRAGRVRGVFDAVGFENARQETFRTLAAMITHIEKCSKLENCSSSTNGMSSSHGYAG